MKRLFLPLFALFLGACSSDACKAEAPSFELEVQAASGIARVLSAIEVEIAANGQRWKKSYPLGMAFTDGVTSIGVKIEPAPTADFMVAVIVRAVDANMIVRAAGTTNFNATANGCNRASITLAVAGPPSDAGAGDASPDGGVATMDDAAQPDALEAPDAIVSPDAFEPDAPAGDSGVADDTGVPDDSGVPPDSGAPPDAGGTPFPYVPSNFVPGSVMRISPSLTLGCGVTIFNSTSGTFLNDCGMMTPTMVVLPQLGGGPAALLAIAGLVISPGSSLQIIGDKPVMLAVFGDATIAGRIDARGVADASGAGGGTDCLNGAGAPPIAGIGGGGGGGFATAGTTGGSAMGAGGVVGTPNGVPSLIPLRGGCPGASGGGAMRGLGGGSGGGIQLSAAGTLSIPGEVQAGGGGGRGGGVAAGGGAGGSGGGILLEGASVSVIGTVVANGGGGGAGGGAMAGPDGANGNIAAARGGVGAGGAGNGGTGQTRMTAASAGQTGASGAGGGGGAGGLGRVRINSVSCMVSGTISPAHSGCP